jgi:hypothetical protein
LILAEVDDLANQRSGLRALRERKDFIELASVAGDRIDLTLGVDIPIEPAIFP